MRCGVLRRRLHEIRLERRQVDLGVHRLQLLLEVHPLLDQLELLEGRDVAELGVDGAEALLDGIGRAPPAPPRAVLLQGLQVVLHRPALGAAFGERRFVLGAHRASGGFGHGSLSRESVGRRPPFLSITRIAISVMANMTCSGHASKRCFATMRLDPMSSASTRQPEPVHRQLGLTDDELDAIVRAARARPDRARARDVRGDVVGALLLQVVEALPRSLPHRGTVGPRRSGRGRRGDRRRRRPRGRHPHREPQPPVGGRALPGRGHRRRRDHPRRLLHGCAADRADGPAALRAARRPPHPLPPRGRGRRDQRLRQRGRGPDGRRRGGVRRVLPRQPTRQRAVPRRAAGRPAGAGEGRGRRQRRRAARVGHRARRHRRGERAGLRRVLRGRRGQAAVGPGGRSLRGEAAHRGLPRAARRRPRRRACRTSAPPASRARRRRRRRRPARAWTSTSPACPSASRA